MLSHLVTLTENFYLKTNDKILINPGSVGQSRDPATKSYACRGYTQYNYEEINKYSSKI